MGVSHYECDGCSCGFRDDDEYCAWCECGNKFCSIKCGKVENYLEEYQEHETDENLDRYRGDRIDNDKPITCKVCRKENHTDYVLYQALLKHYNLTEEDAIKIWKEQD